MKAAQLGVGWITITILIAAAAAAAIVMFL
jgi:hypothetical protein